jgi:hypothetical protein
MPRSGSRLVNLRRVTSPPDYGPSAGGRSARVVGAAEYRLAGLDSTRPLRLAKAGPEILATLDNGPCAHPAIHGRRRRSRTPLALCPPPVLPGVEERRPRRPYGALQVSLRWCRSPPDGGPGASKSPRSAVASVGAPTPRLNRALLSRRACSALASARSASCFLGAARVGKASLRRRGGG